MFFFSSLFLCLLLIGGVEEFRNKYPEWCMIRGSEKLESSLPNLRICSAGEVAPLVSRAVAVQQQRSVNRRPGSLGSRSASDSEEERPDSSLESAEIRTDFHENPPEFGSGFSLGLSVGLRLGLESEPLVLDEVDPTEVDPDPGFPVEILPHLFLGNAQNSRDCDALAKHEIRVRIIQSTL